MRKAQAVNLGFLVVHTLFRAFSVCILALFRAISAFSIRTHAF